MWQRNAPVFVFICVSQASGSYSNFEIHSVACSFENEINSLKTCKDIKCQMWNAKCFDVLKNRQRTEEFVCKHKQLPLPAAVWRRQHGAFSESSFYRPLLTDILYCTSMLRIKITILPLVAYNLPYSHYKVELPSPVKCLWLTCPEPELDNQDFFSMHLPTLKDFWNLQNFSALFANKLTIYFLEGS